ncbi:hypothetical protein HQ399_19790 [Aeromonas jandaei]|uniref:Uncharacterized protein n=1 Tax=Aeromonas jandaei TaxID=650 RepID=A0ABD7EVC0_AERJA|nr:hypothetical protein [Aeromonas jandaei]QWL64326.1 hypothetical protein HQ399_19790 [Aeromonas jandaei]
MVEKLSESLLLKKDAAASFFIAAKPRRSALKAFGDSEQVSTHARSATANSEVLTRQANEEKQAGRSGNTGVAASWEEAVAAPLAGTSEMDKQ